MHPTVANTLNKIKEGYEDLLSIVVEGLVNKIDDL